MSLRAYLMPEKFDLLPKTNGIPPPSKREKYGFPLLPHSTRFQIAPKKA
jgi:hypothetical protein